ncbi:MAG: aldo/keto reductase [Dehalococcoidia bacterium]|nr:aldo/keto reductase [Dehalococcoidia bacterium]
MQHRRIQGTDVEVSEVGFGVWTVAAGWWGEYSDHEAAALMHRAVERGVTFFDTADAYGRGRGETVVAHAFPGSERDKITIGAKFGYDWASRDAADAGHRESPHRLDIPFLERALEDSLRRLGTDRIDVFAMHNPRMEHLQNDDVWTWIERIQREGKIRSAGVALGPAIGWEPEGHYAMRNLPIQSVQMIYNALELDPGRPLIQTAEETGMSLLVRVPHSSGMLEGHYTADTVFPENDHRRHRPQSWLTEGVQKVEHLRFLERENNCTMGQAAIQFILRTPSIVTVLPNVYDAAQLDEFTAAPAQPPVTDAQAAEIARLYEANYGLPVTEPANVTDATIRAQDAKAQAEVGANS